MSTNPSHSETIPPTSSTLVATIPITPKTTDGIISSSGEIPHSEYLLRKLFSTLMDYTSENFQQLQDTILKKKIRLTKNQEYIETMEMLDQIRKDREKEAASIVMMTPIVATTTAMYYNSPLNTTRGAMTHGNL